MFHLLVKHSLYKNVQIDRIAYKLLKCFEMKFDLCPTAYTKQKNKISNFTSNIAGIERYFLTCK
jgi:hypothetical protein